jgi:hypothetical protein
MDFEIWCESNSSQLIVSRGINPQPSLSPERKLFNWDEVRAAVFYTEDAKVVDLALVVAPDDTRFRVVRIAAAHVERDRTFSEPACLALNTWKSGSVVDDKVIARVFPERNEEVRNLLHSAQAWWRAQIDRPFPSGAPFDWACLEHRLGRVQNRQHAFPYHEGAPE